MKIVKKLLAWCAVAAMLLALMPVIGVSAAYENTHVNTGDQRSDIVAVAKTQVGYLEGSLAGTSLVRNNYTKYGVWYDNNVANIGGSYGEWCAMFVSWCANQAGIPSSIMYYHASCSIGISEWKSRGVWKASAYWGGSYTPQAGDIIYFASTAGSSTPAHVGIVTSCSGGYVYTVEGNTSTTGFSASGGTCNSKSYSLSNGRILGYASPHYEDNSGYPISFESNGGSAVESVRVKEGATLTRPADPWRYGFDFAGWYCDPELNDPYDFSTPVYYDFTLYAKWSEAYWGANTNLMPNEGQLQFNSYNDADERVWAYFADDSYGSVTMYNGVTDESWTWPSAYMEYMNSFDAAHDAYIYVKKDGTAQFNIDFTYLDAEGNSHTVKLSEIAGNGTADFAEGYLEGFYNIGDYVAKLGHLPASGNLKFTKVTYFVIGGLDSYVKLYDLKLTPAFELTEPYKSLYSNEVQYYSGSGSYEYNNGTLTLTADTDDGYGVHFPASTTFDPCVMANLVTNLTSDVPYNIQLHVTDGTTASVIDFRKDFFNIYGLDTVPEALPAGSFCEALNLYGYYYWNELNTATGTVTDVIITLAGKGTLSLYNLQASETTTVIAVNDGLTASGYHENTAQLTSSVYTVGAATVTSATDGMTVADFTANFDQATVIVCDADGNAVDSTAIVTSGMTVKTDAATAIAYTVVIRGDVNADGYATTADARLVLDGTLINALSGWQAIAAEYNEDGVINTTDVRDLLIATVS